MTSTALRAQERLAVKGGSMEKFLLTSAVLGESVSGPYGFQAMLLKARILIDTTLLRTSTDTR